MKITFETGDTQVALLTHDLDPGEIEQVIGLFENIAVEQSWQTTNQLRAYLKNSVYFALYVSGDLVGALQLVVGNTDESLPCLTVWPELELSGGTDIADIALLALRRRYRGQTHQFILLLVEMWRYCISHNIVDLYLEATPQNITDHIRRGFPLKIVGELRLHWGESCLPCRISVRDIEKVAQTRSLHSSKYKIITEQMYR